MKRHIRRFTEVVIVLVALGAGLFSQRVLIADWISNQLKPELPPAVSFEETQKQPAPIQKPEPKPVEELQAKSPSKEPPKNVDVPVEPVKIEPSVQVQPSNVEPAPETGLPASVNLAVAFTPQAPYGDWSLPFQEACEEASLYMVDSYYKNVPIGLIPAETAKTAILGLVDFEMELFGAYEDTTIQQVATLAEMSGGYERIEVMNNPSVEEIKHQVAAGRPVIVPTAGRLLGNPYFQQPGPIYHMLVIRGYTTDGKFITNDPGTRRGEAFLYNEETLMNAMHDWSGGEDISLGAKRILVIYPN